MLPAAGSSSRAAEAGYSNNNEPTNMKTSLLDEAPLKQPELEACHSYVLSYLEADRKSSLIRARQPGPAVTIS
jgi:hypothetical protein